MVVQETCLTVHNAQPVIDAAIKAVRAGDLEIDMSNVTVVDSAALGLLIAAWRERPDKSKLYVKAAPSGLAGLMDAYGIRELFHDVEFKD